MDTAQVFAECLPFMEGIRPWVATIQLVPGAEELHVGIGHLNVTAGYLFVGVTFLCQTMIVLSRGATLCRLEGFVFWVQGWGKSHPWIKSVRHL